MSQTLDNRAEIRRALLRLLAMSTSDGSLSEHEDSSGDTLNHIIQHGVWEAQNWYLNNVDPTRWKKRSSALSWSGSDSADGGRYASLPTDFLRLWGDDERSALHEADGTRWGRLIDANLRWEVTGNYYWLENDNLWIARGAAPPATLYMDYNYRHPEFADDVTAPEFPVQHRPLVVAFAGEYAMHHPFFPGSPELAARVSANLDYWKRSVYIGGRRSREPRKQRSGNVIGRRWFAGG